MIKFGAPVQKINSQFVVVLPNEASAALPSRGMVMVSGTLNGTDFTSPLEPDGRGSHWLAIDTTLQRDAGISEADDYCT